MNVKLEAFKLENRPMDLHTNVHINQELDGAAEEEQKKMEEENLYADHEIKEELVTGPVVLQPPALARARCVQNISDGLDVDTQPYKCDTNTKCYTGKYHLKCHKLTGTGDKPNQNVSTQTGRKQHECGYCNKGFGSKYLLNTHLMIHTGENSYKCDICNKLFAAQHEVKSHLMIHTGENPYECDICNKRFAAKYTLKRHVMVHTGGKQHKCDHCNKSFVYKSSHKAHLRTHTGEKQVCKKRGK